MASETYDERAHGREVLRLAVPAFLALVAEPLYLLADAAIVGHLGTTELAGIGIASVVLQTAVGLCVFLAYGTTASVARKLGAGDTRGALVQGIDGTWLAIGIGLLMTVVGVAATGSLVDAFGAGDAVSDQAESYLRVAFLGTAPLLVMLAATGVLRGLQDTRTPLYVAVGGNLLNVVLNYALVYGAGPVPRLEIAGAALGSVIAQSLSAAALLAVVVRAARREGASLRPHLPGIRAAGTAGVPLLVRTVTLRAAILVTTYAATLLAATAQQREVDLATHQVAMTLWTFVAFALDAIAIAAQAIIGRYLGAGDVAGTRAMTSLMIRWGIYSGAAIGLTLGVLSPWLGYPFSSDPAVRDLLTPVIVVAALGMPMAGVVMVLDGVLIGAGDGVYLAWGGLVVLVAYAPFAMLAGWLGLGLPALWAAFAGVFMGARCWVLVARARGEKWMVTGA